MDDLGNSRCLEGSGAIPNSCNKEPPCPDKYPRKHTCNHHLHEYPGKGNESDPTNTLANTRWQCQQTLPQCAGGVSTIASADMLANVSVGSDLSFLLFHAKEIFVHLNKGFFEIIIA